MINTKIYSDISKRTGGELYVGVVGPVRTGKSTFVKKFLEEMMLPNILNEYDRTRARDVMPQSASGKTVMTAEPKFIPDEAVEVVLSDNAAVKMRLIDCVGYLVPGAVGHTENGEPRMVKTPWHENEIPFEQAAEEGTSRVITDHSTVAMLVTCDGSFGDIPRENYIEAEERIVSELKALNKPFCVIMNTSDPESTNSVELALNLENRYGCPVALLNCLEIDSEDIDNIFSMLLYEFPVTEIDVNFPEWMKYLPEGHHLTGSIVESTKACIDEIHNMGDIKSVFSKINLNPNISEANVTKMDMSSGSVEIDILPEAGIYYKTLEEITGLDLENESKMFSAVCELSDIKRKYDRVSSALEEVESKGYGIVMPDISELELDEPEIVRQAGNYGVKLRASAKSIHMIKATIDAEINPIVGTEQQSEDLIAYLTNEFQENPTMIWNTDLLGKSLYDLVNEGLRSKLQNMPDESRVKLSETLEKIINEGCGGLICIIL